MLQTDHVCGPWARCCRL